MQWVNHWVVRNRKLVDAKIRETLHPFDYRLKNDTDRVTLISYYPALKKWAEQEHEVYFDRY